MSQWAHIKRVKKAFIQGYFSKLFFPKITYYKHSIKHNCGPTPFLARLAIFLANFPGLLHASRCVPTNYMISVPYFETQFVVNIALRAIKKN